MAVPHGFGVAFTADALDPTPSYTLINTLTGISVQGFKVDRGRSSELDKIQTGTASVDFIDQTGALDPTNSSGTFYGQIDPVKPMALGLYNPVTTTWHQIFTGHTNDLAWSLDLTERYLNCSWDCVDLFELMAALEMSPAQHGQTPPADSEGDIYFLGEESGFKHVDQRIKDALNDAGIPSAFWDIFSGNVSVQEKIYERRDQLLTVLQDAADAEFPGVANVYVSADGLVRFRGRYARFFPDRPGYGINTWLAGDKTACDLDPDVAPIAPVEFRRSASDIINAATATPLGVDDADVPGQLSKDDTSIATYGWRSASGSFDSLLTFEGHTDADVTTSAVEETKLFADYYADNFFEPRTRLSKLVFRPVGLSHPNATALWALMTGVEIGDVITVTTTHPGGGGFDGEDFYVEGIHYDADTSGGANFTNVTLELDVSPRSYFDSNPFGSRDDTVSVELTGTFTLAATGSAA